MTGQNKSPTANLKSTITTSVRQDNKDAAAAAAAGDDVTATDAAARATDAGDDVERLDARYAEFKGDPEKMQQLDEFVTGLLVTAEKEADIRREAKRVGAPWRGDLGTEMSFLQIFSFAFDCSWKQRKDARVCIIYPFRIYCFRLYKITET